MFMIGIAVFSAASLACGLAGSIGVLIAARVVQGLGAAIISPATLSIITTTFEEGSERNKALGIWGAMGGSGAAAGVLFGGILTKYLGWEWIFFVNVPVGAIVLALTRPLVRESRIPGLRGFDFAGAATITSSLALLVYGISKAPDVGWSSGRTIGFLIAAALLLVAFVVTESRHPIADDALPDLPRANGHRRERGRLPARRCRVLELLPADPVRAAGAALLGAEGGPDVPGDSGDGDPRRGIVAGAVTRLGARPVLIAGLRCRPVDVWYTQIPVHGSFAADLLPGYLAIGFGLAFSFIPMSIAALAGVEHDEAGLASGLINTTQQIGGALGVAIVATVAFTHAKHAPLHAERTDERLRARLLGARRDRAVRVVAAITLVRARARTRGGRVADRTKRSPTGDLRFPEWPTSTRRSSSSSARTPIVRLDRARRRGGAQILAKLEYLNPGGSVKDRIGLRDDRGRRARRAS